MSSSVLKIYKTVMDEVITGVKNDFLDEGVDEQVLLELRHNWEKKIAESKAVEPQEPPAPLVKAKPEPGIVQPSITIQRNPPATSDQQFTIPQIRQVLPQTQAPTQIIYPGGAAGGASNFTIRVPPTQTGAITLPPELTAQLLNSSNGTLTPFQMQALQNVVFSRQEYAKSTGQAQYTITVPVAGAGQVVQSGMPGQIATVPRQITVGTTVQPVGTAQQLQHQLQQQQLQQQVQQASAAGQTIRVVKMPGQTDGATLDSSDSDDSSDDDRVGGDDDGDDLDEDEDDNQDNEVDEEPLNSDDDVTDEEVSEVQETDNVVVCQYDKITRSRNRWKFHLKDGIMNIQGRDYLFQKLVGDAEW